MKNTIKSHRDFNFEGEKSISTPAFIMKYRKKLRETGEYGLVVSKKIFPHAVQRNRAKRMLREWLRGCVPPNDFDILLIARTEILQTPMPTGARQMKAIVKKIK
ncbi:MAG: ribonuclease P protein component [Rickettsiales bacterium]|jgi:ribonuclease P protein component|nr:ribonuclease P protein component [Rickettsiales bacterium]